MRPFLHSNLFDALRGIQELAGAKSGRAAKRIVLCSPMAVKSASDLRAKMFRPYRIGRPASEEPDECKVTFHETTIRMGLRAYKPDGAIICLCNSAETV
jgi:hypothetical protein